MIVVAGATGYLGGMIARRLLGQGQPVRVLVRPGADGRPLVAAGAQPVTADLKDRASLDAVCRGAETVVTTANSAQRGGADTLEAVDRAGNRNLIDAARAAGVRKFVFTSALGASEDSPVPFLQAKARTEQHLRASGLPYTILCPNTFMDVWFPMVVDGPVRAGQPVMLVGEGRRHAFVATADVAGFATAAIDHPAARNAQIVIGGPEALSWRDVVAVYERVLGRPIEVRSVPPGEPVPGLPPVIGQLLTGMGTYDSLVDMADTARTYGVRLTTAEAFVRGQAAE